MKIIWSEKADESFDEILDWIGEKFTQKEVDKFVETIYEVLVNLKEFPKSYPVSKRLEKVRKAVIHPHSSLYHRIGRKEIELLFFHDNRRNPKIKLK